MTSTLICPLLSSGKDIDMICLKEKCAWYLPAYKSCSIYVTAHDAALNIRSKQAQMQNTPN